LSKWDIPINVLLFQVFEHEGRQILGRTWLLDPAETQVNSVNAPIESNNEPWNGEYYCSFGQSHTRSWDEAMKHGFVSAGGGSWYSNTLKRLEPGKRIWVNAIGSGYVGVGIVTGHATPAREFFIETPEGRYPALEILGDGTYHKEYLDDDAKCEYFVTVEWLHTTPLSGAIKKAGLFGNQNSICRPKAAKWQTTIEYLKSKFPKWDGKPGRI